MYNSRKKMFENFEIILDMVYGVELIRFGLF